MAAGKGEICIKLALISVSVSGWFGLQVNVTKTFVDYIKNQPLVFEVFGHFQQVLNRDKTHPPQAAGRQPPRRMLPPLLPVSQPLRSTKFAALPPSPVCQV